MTALLFIAAITCATLQAWWASIILFAMGCAYLYDLHLREQENERQADRRCKAELRRQEQEAKR